MAADNMQKIKLIKLYELLKEETDAEHAISRTELCRRLNEMGISSNVRTLSLDVQVLNDNGYEILSYKEKKEKFFYVPEREFSLPEIRILMDAVQAASFVTPKKTDELIEKIAALGGSHRAKLLKKNVVKFNTRKHTNETVLYTVDSLTDALDRGKKVTFNYFDLDENGERVFRLAEDGEIKLYQVEPVALIFNEDNYYLLAYSKKHPESAANYRVDRMYHAKTVEKSKISPEASKMVKDVSKYTGQVFKMYNGEQSSVTLRFDRSLIGPVYDKFGEEIKMTAAGDEIETTVQVRVSPTFFGWLAQFGGRMRITEPEDVIGKYRGHIERIFMNKDLHIKQWIFTIYRKPHARGDEPTVWDVLRERYK